MGRDRVVGAGVVGKWRRLDSLGVWIHVGHCWWGVGGFWWARVTWVRVFELESILLIVYSCNRRVGMPGIHCKSREDFYQASRASLIVIRDPEHRDNAYKAENDSLAKRRVSSG